MRARLCRMKKAYMLLVCLVFIGIAIQATARTASESSANPPGDSTQAEAQQDALLKVEEGHPWCPPFGLARVGQPIRIVITPLGGLNKGEELFLAGYRGDHTVFKEKIEFTDQSSVVKEVDPSIDRVNLIAGKDVASRELASLVLERKELEAEAVAHLKTPVNPIDLGAVFPPANGLVLAPDQTAQVRVAAFSRTLDASGARVLAWFEARPSQRVEAELSLTPGNRGEVEMDLPKPSFHVDRDVLHVAIQDRGGNALWRKQIPVMLIKEPPEWPQFGARETMLRYDLPISVRDPQTGALSTMPYDQGWPERLKDIVVSLPNGSRFVFWRGSSYVPFWAGKHNTALSYEWAETGPLPEGFVDSVEPLMDKELRYGKASIVESTAARVHVRWTYQSCDFNYKVWGDAAQEDFYFYPDGFGTRVLTLNSAPNADYEISEFILLAPPEGYPLDMVPDHPIKMLAMDGSTGVVPIPLLTEKTPPGPAPPLIYRVQFGKNERETAVYFNPRDSFRVEELVTFRPFYDRGYMVTPAYWGSHWPLARGKTTGGAIDDRLHVSPSHNSLMSWARHRPEPIWIRTGPSVDTLGCSRQMQTQCWVWLIGMTSDSDDRLIARAGSFNEPVSLDVQGADIDTESYVMERRAYRLVIKDNIVVITIKPSVRSVNPVFELLGASKMLVHVELANRQLHDDEYAWDGQTFWLGVDINETTRLQLEFKN